MKRLFTCLLAVIMLLGSMTLVASAATVNGEETITVTFSTSGNPGFGSMGMTWGYDAGLELVSVTNGVAIANDGKASYFALDGKDVTGDVTLFTATFSVAKAADGATYGIWADLDEMSTANAANDYVTFDIVVSPSSITTDEAACEHDYVLTTDAATCTEDGLNTYTCSKCGDTYTETIAALGHSWGEWTVTTPAGCLVAGVETRTCSVCEEIETREIAATGHIDEDGDGICDYCKTPLETDDEDKPVVPVVPVDPDLDDEPKTGDITPMITMTVAGVVAMAAAAFFFVFKRKAAK